MIEIDKGIPIPPTKKPRRRLKYPWQTMEIGDSFLSKALKISMMSFCVKRSIEGKKFTCRQVEDGVRVWRTA